MACDTPHPHRGTLTVRPVSGRPLAEEGNPGMQSTIYHCVKMQTGQTHIYLGREQTSQPPADICTCFIGPSAIR